MTWYCPAIDHGISIFPDNRIRPCCQASADYSKPLDRMLDPDRFQDLKNQDRPDACRKCWENEDHGRFSYRQYYLAKGQQQKTGIRFLDFRHTNQCNLKCRYCNPHFSNQWAKELGYEQTLLISPIQGYLDSLITQDLEDVYWCGGEPFMIKDHYDFLNRAIAQGISKNIVLRYSTNLTLLDYKNVDIVALWSQFKTVRVAISIDAVGPILNCIRSGTDWTTVEKNIARLLAFSSTCPTISVEFTPTITMLNLWSLPDLMSYAKEHKIKVSANILTGPDYLSLDAVPVQLQPRARDIVDSIKSYLSPDDYTRIMHMLSRDDNEYLFLHAVRHILLLDKIRDENLFDFLPYRQLSIDLTAKNNEYE